jgi:vacuolar-type H+-ATPase subunit F/Vma7
MRPVVEKNYGLVYITTSPATTISGRISRWSTVHRLRSIFKLILGKCKTSEKLTHLNSHFLLSSQRGTPHDSVSKLSVVIKDAYKVLDEKLLEKYTKLTSEEVKILVVDDKWFSTIKTNIQGEIDSISQHLTGRIKELAERYETNLAVIDSDIAKLTDSVNFHLQSMGLVWN